MPKSTERRHSVATKLKTIQAVSSAGRKGDIADRFQIPAYYSSIKCTNILCMYLYIAL